MEPCWRPSHAPGTTITSVERGVTDGEVTDLGPKLSFWFTDPDGTHVEVGWVRDPSLHGFHAPVPVSRYPSPMPAGAASGEVGP